MNIYVSFKTQYRSHLLSSLPRPSQVGLQIFCPPHVSSFSYTTVHRIVPIGLPAFLPGDSDFCPPGELRLCFIHLRILNAGHSVDPQ